ncbi:MAG TPA: ABC transporter substrate-binding protein [Pseudolysinimonas sp.]|jgi:peptide/nickel transport system substrate-binding protein
MTLALGRTRRLAPPLAAVAALALLLAGCAGGAQVTRSGPAIIIGAVGPTPSLDPAGPSDQGSLALQSQLFSGLMTTDPDTGDLEPDIAASAAFTGPTDFTVRLRPGQRFANGDALTSADVKFSFARQLAIKDPDGPSKDLAGLVSISTPDADTVVFHLTSADQTFERVLASAVGTIVDQQVFSATALTPNATIVSADAFGGQYRVDSYHDTLITLEPNADYAGYLGAPRTSSISLKLYSRSADARLDLQDGNLDIAYGLSGDDIALGAIDKNLRVSQGAGAETRFLVFNLNTMPYGAAQGDADPRKALAVRQAVADLIDREALSKAAYSGTALPLFSVVPIGQADALGTFLTEYGNGQGASDFEAARSILDDAGVATPVALTLQFTPSQFGEEASDEFKELRTQLEDAGLFTIKLQFSEYPQFTKDIAADAYPVYQGERVSDVADPNDSLSAFRSGAPFAVHFADTTVDAEIDKAMLEPDAATRSGLVQDIQLRITAAVPVIPLLQDEQIAVSAKSVSGVVFDPRSGLRFGNLIRSGQ